ncbi:hypothetical protein BDP27DRAFT_89345 [Rhodocollybia butyracea]|uniref:Cyanovirin-N domain-containing protein n=1 Tax=Rhodocollybia butyracea TaxID=206335 RepID=A0A9P5UC86_9AGAR|nr:hypothetical protein BDP27DRAFT_89345 [Rhodocollybia butyracea]
MGRQYRCTHAIAQLWVYKGSFFRLSFSPSTLHSGVHPTMSIKLATTLSLLLPFVYGQSLLEFCSDFTLSGSENFQLNANCETAAGGVEAATLSLIFDCLAYEENANRLVCPFPLPGNVAEDPIEGCENCSITQEAIFTCECFADIGQGTFLSVNLGVDSCVSYSPNSGMTCAELD